MTTRTTRRNAKARGKRFEMRLAELGDGTVWPGTDGDVDIHGCRVEAKYRANFDGLKMLARFIEQAQSNGVSAGKPWALALTGGKTYQNGAVFILLPFEEWDRLCRLEADTRTLEPLLKDGDYTRALRRVFDTLVGKAARELADERGESMPG